jgi:hypothetical protein
MVQVIISEKEDKDIFLGFADTILKAEPLEKNDTYYYRLKEKDFNSSGLELINTLLLGLSRNIVSDNEKIALVKDAVYTRGEDVELWVDPKALNYLKY